MPRNNSNNKREWKPKGFIMSVTVDMETGKSIPGKPVFAKMQEEEERMEEEFAGIWLRAMKVVWGYKFNWFMDNLKYLVDKHGEKEFTKQWNKEMQKQDLKGKNTERKK